MDGGWNRRLRFGRHHRHQPYRPAGDTRIFQVWRNRALPCAGGKMWSPSPRILLLLRKQHRWRLRAAPKEELAPSRDAPEAAQIPEQAVQVGTAPQSQKNKDDNLKSQSENKPCPANRLVYAANGIGDVEGAASVIEIVFESKHKEDLETAASSEFEIREYRNNQIERTYKGKFLQKVNSSRFAFPFLQSRMRRPVSLEPHYIKPNRDGTGEPILYVAGLHKLSTSKKTGRPSKSEGKRPTEVLPEVFYFDRCE